jgi:NTE family protein
MDSRSGRDQECILVLQGGGALGAYQAGVFETLSESGHRPEWVAGISIGAINAALIAGNPPERQVERLREFWELVSSGLAELPVALPAGIAPGYLNDVGVTGALMFGASGFFFPRLPPPMFQPKGTDGAISYYDTAPLKATLERLVDFDRINRGPVRLAVGAVNVATGNFVYFDSANCPIDARHVMASGALPPGFPPVEIDGEWYWDGGLVSNTPLQYVLDQPDGPHREVFQVDLFPAHGMLPATMDQVGSREKEIRFSSRTRQATTIEVDREVIARSAQRLLAKLPPELRDDPDAQALGGLRTHCASLDVVHLIYRSQDDELQSKDYEFSRRAMQTHWQSGLADMQVTLRDPRWVNRSRGGGELHVFDLVPRTAADAQVPPHDRRRPDMQGFRQAA